MTHRHRIVAVALVVAVVFVAGGALAVSIDTETTNTTTTSNITDGGTLSATFAADPATGSYLEIVTTSSNPAVDVIDGETGAVVRTFPADSFDQPYVNATTDTFHYARTVSHDELANVPIDAGETKTIAFRIRNNASLNSTATTWANVTVTGIENRTVVAAAGPNLSVTPRDDGWSVLGYELFATPTIASFETNQVPINGTNSTVRVTLPDPDVADGFAARTAGLTNTSWAYTVPVTINDTLVKTYYKSAGAVGPNATYAVYHPASDAVTIHTGGDFANATTLDIGLSNDAPSIRTMYESFGLSGLFRAVTGWL